MKLCYTKNKALRDEICPKAFYRDNWQGQPTLSAKLVYTDMPIVREAYEARNIEVIWMGDETVGELPLNEVVSPTTSDDGPDTQEPDTQEPDTQASDDGGPVDTWGDDELRDDS